MTSDAVKMKNFKKISKPLCLANNQRTLITGVGEINVQNQNGLTQKLVDTLYVPDLKMNLMSVAKIVDSGCKVIFEPQTAMILSDKNEVLQKANRYGNLYFIENANVVVESQKSKIMQWHERLGHLNETSLRNMSSKGTVRGLDFSANEKMEFCETCVKGKQTQTSFPHSKRRSNVLLEIVHTDICGPMRVKSKGGSLYFITFIDDRSRWCEVHFLKKKSEALGAF